MTHMMIPYDDALVATIEIDEFYMKRVLVNEGSSMDTLFFYAIGAENNSRRLTSP